tara:strand:+ start:158 stop:583 length:426 start_codon:yes stop_codon:yes gene_type:complete
MAGKGAPKGSNNGGGAKKGSTVVKGYHAMKDGNIWRETKNKCTLVKQWTSQKGYMCASIFGKTVEVHRVVAQQLIPNPDNKEQIDHINRVRHDNRVENLRWVTRKENNENKVWGGSEQNAIDFLTGLGYTITKGNNHGQHN